MQILETKLCSSQANKNRMVFGGGRTKGLAFVNAASTPHKSLSK